MSVSGKNPHTNRCFSPVTIHILTDMSVSGNNPHTNRYVCLRYKSNADVQSRHKTVKRGKMARKWKRNSPYCIGFSTYLPTKLGTSTTFHAFYTCYVARVPSYEHTMLTPNPVRTSNYNLKKKKRENLKVRNLVTSFNSETLSIPKLSFVLYTFLSPIYYLWYKELGTLADN
jgi:hypothetical protein